ncbi:putative membrane protein [Carnobacterium iners]|uniref:Putative membrane protein n=2 Tax=Carnobacterium iners TaxID=1073423 RepID=A0A1X7MU42_9LACT|nr:SHOCT domain-containing protein [Carnobacterium iners]SEK56653.1 putative membrane protein [Carnobacterium iners]SMH28154.1 putative membrane protein [Carnobacterium iners]
MHNRFDYMGPNMTLSWLIPLVVLLVIVLSIYMIKKNNNDNKINRDNKESALNISDKRYANGEIDEEEYLKKKNILKNK